MRTAVAAAGARSPPLPAHPLSPSPERPSPVGAGLRGEPRLLLEDAAAAVPSASQARPRLESPAGASVEAPGAPSALHLLWPLRLRQGPEGWGVSYRLKITKRDGWVTASRPTTGQGEGLGQPPLTSQRWAACGGAGRTGSTWEMRTEPGAQVPGEPESRRCRNRNEAGGRAGSGRAAPAVPPTAEMGARGQPSDPAPGRVQSPDLFVRKTTLISLFFSGQVTCVPVYYNSLNP